MMKSKSSWSKWLGFFLNLDISQWEFLEQYIQEIFNTEVDRDNDETVIIYCEEKDWKHD